MIREFSLVKTTTELLTRQLESDRLVAQEVENHLQITEGPADGDRTPDDDKKVWVKFEFH